MHKRLPFLAKSFLPKETLSDTTILIISILFIKTGLYVGKTFVFQFKYHQILYLSVHFYINFQFFYNFFNVIIFHVFIETRICSKFTDSKITP